MEKIFIYNDDVCEYADKYKKDIIDFLSENDTTPNDDNIFEQARADIDAYFEDIKSALSFYNAIENNKILAVADFGLWYGRRKATKVFNNLYDAVLNCFEDVNALYFDNKRATLTLRATHHDGENIIKFYMLKNGRKYAIKYEDIIQ